MLSYSFSVLNEQGYKSIATEKFDNIAELMAAILVKGIATQLKRGLQKEYIGRTEELSLLRGKIDVSESVKTQTMLKSQMVCSYDEFSVNGLMNRILKSTVHLLLKSDISAKRKKELKKLMVFFADVELIDLNTVNWNIQYNRTNQTYQMMISICYLVVKGLLQTNSYGNTKLMDFIDEQRMCYLYEKFILQYYKKEFPQLSVNASRISWQLDDGEDTLLPIMQSDISLQKDNTVLIIDAKYYSHTTLQKWISLYNANRELRDYDPKREVYMAEARRKTTLAERKKIVEYCITYKRDYKGTASLYDVSYSQVYSWVRKYDIAGEDVYWSSIFVTLCSINTYL